MKRFGLRVLIAGASGAMGSYLAEYIRTLREHHTIWGIGRRQWRRQTNGWKDVFDYYQQLDLSLNPLGLASFINVGDFDLIFNLASDANVRQSFQSPVEFTQNNVCSMVALLDAIVRSKSKARLVVCSTSEVYGNVPQEINPIEEDGFWAPDEPYASVSPYAATKVCQEVFATTYARLYGIPMVTTRAFGYINPRREDLVATALARQIVRCERGEASEIVHGDLAPVRSFADARDIAAAYWMAATRTSWKIGNVYNIGSTEPCSIGQLLDMMNQGRFPHREERALKRPSDIFYCVPKVDRFVRDTGWEPKYTLRQSLDWLLETVREQSRETMPN